MDQQFGGDVGGEIDGDLGPDFQKRSRFDSPQVESELDRLDVPPATLRILVRQIDAGGIIGKVCRESRQFTNSFRPLHGVVALREMSIMKCGGFGHGEKEL